MAEVNQAKTAATGDLLMLRMELKAIRDRAVADFDAAIARVDAAIPNDEPLPQAAAMKKWTPARWREFMEKGR